MKLFYAFFFCLMHTIVMTGQYITQAKHDSLRGSITESRAWWDVTYYHLDIKVDPKTKTIAGKNTIHYTVIKDHDIMQIDLQKPMRINKVMQDDKILAVKSIGNAHFITLEKEQAVTSKNKIEVYYDGKPTEAINPPWDGGISWKKDENNKHFIASSCQVLGASVWWPNKDHLYDEVDSLLVSVNVPSQLMNVSNGKLRDVQRNLDLTTTYHWFVSEPINNYNVAINIGNYVNFGDTYEGEKGKLKLDYYVLKDNLKKAQKQFTDVPRLLKAFEHWFGPYPFYDDSYKVVETPYLGMEHQSAIAYGNKYKNGYLGSDVSLSGWGSKFDYILIHESGHEWFGNSITNKDVADMWIHEGFTAYSESLFVDYHYGKKAASEYVIGTRSSIVYDAPIIGKYDVNKQGSDDMYFKGSNMLHTLRQLINDDEKWREILRGINKEFYHTTVTTAEIEGYLNSKTTIDLSLFFDQYLRNINIPTLEYSFIKGNLKYRYTNTIANYAIPLRIFANNQEIWITPSTTWQTKSIAAKNITIDPNFYIETKNEMQLVTNKG